MPARATSLMNKRRKYRVRLAQDEHLRVAVLKAGAKPVPGRIIDISMRGIAVQFEPWREPVYALGEKLELQLRSRAHPEPILVPCLVRRRSEMSEGRYYGFEFTKVSDLAKLPSALAKVFNKRRDYRVKPDPRHPIVVKVEGKSSVFDMLASLLHVSTGGLSFWAPHAVENLLVSTQRVKVTFRLPTHRRDLTFWSQIVHRTLTGRGVTYGVAFDPECTSQFARKQVVLNRYVFERRRELLVK